MYTCINGTLKIFPSAMARINNVIGATNNQYLDHAVSLRCLILKLF